MWPEFHSPYCKREKCEEFINPLLPLSMDYGDIIGSI